MSGDITQDSREPQHHMRGSPFFFSLYVLKLVEGDDVALERVIVPPVILLRAIHAYLPSLSYAQKLLTVKSSY